MKDFLSVVFSGGLLAVLILMLLILSPMIFLWAINILSESSGSALYIPHEFWTYIACYGIFLCVRGSSSSKS